MEYYDDDCLGKNYILSTFRRRMYISDPHYSRISRPQGPGTPPGVQVAFNIVASLPFLFCDNGNIAIIMWVPGPNMKKRIVGT
jgi:hypothetical protein